MKVYLLFYDEDNGERENWSVFYTPCEVFADAATRDARMAYVKTQRPDVEFDTREVDVETTYNFAVE
jgi:hypothetical protein